MGAILELEEFLRLLQDSYYSHELDTFTEETHQGVDYLFNVHTFKIEHEQFVVSFIVTEITLAEQKPFLDYDTEKDYQCNLQLSCLINDGEDLLFGTVKELAFEELYKRFAD